MGSSQLVLSFQQYLTTQIGLGETQNDNDQYFSNHNHSCIHGLSHDWELEVFILTPLNNLYEYTREEKVWWDELNVCYDVIGHTHGMDYVYSTNLSWTLTCLIEKS